MLLLLLENRSTPRAFSNVNIPAQGISLVLCRGRGVEPTLMPLLLLLTCPCGMMSKEPGKG